MDYMINKQNLWFLTLFSLIIVLSVYYVTMPSELLEASGVKKEVVDGNDKIEFTITESGVLAALRVEKEESRLEEATSLKAILTNAETSIDDKNNAYEKLKALNLLRGKEEELEVKIKEEFSTDAYVKIDNDQIRVVIANVKHTPHLANNIMRSIQEEFDTKMYISIKFQE